MEKYSRHSPSPSKKVSVFNSVRVDGICIDEPEKIYLWLQLDAELLANDTTAARIWIIYPCVRLAVSLCASVRVRAFVCVSLTRGMCYGVLNGSSIRDKALCRFWMYLSIYGMIQVDTNINNLNISICEFGKCLLCSDPFVVSYTFIVTLCEGVFV